MTPRFRDITEFMAFATDRSRAHPTVVKVLDFFALMAPAWVMFHDMIRRVDWKYFQIIPVLILQALGREVPNGWPQPMIKEPGGYIGLIMTDPTKADTTWFLVRVKGEPGNLGIQVDGVNSRNLVGPPLQFSWETLKLNDDIRAGKAEGAQTPLAFLHNDPRYPSVGFKLPKDGGRFFEKQNGINMITVPNCESLEADLEQEVAGKPDFAWVSHELLYRLLLLGVLNEHLCEAMALLGRP